jgi:tRNA pseudouridine38-40 synthase
VSQKRNYRVLIEYDGTHYCGWQYQDAKTPTIQGELIRALTIIAKDKVLVTGSSRTDSGVHAEGLVANFHLGIPIAAESLQKAVNAILPQDIRIRRCEIADISFNARYGALSKTYRYRLYFGQVPSPFSIRYQAHMPYPFNIRAMRLALPHFVGSHDFSSFTSDEPDKKRQREISSFTLKKKGEELVFEIRGKSFLRYMVRNIVGTIIDIGRAKIPVSDLPEIFAAKDRRRAGQSAPARGLTLVEVSYQEPWRGEKKSDGSVGSV